MKVYKLVHKKYKGDVMLGLPQTYKNKPGEKYIQEKLNNFKPWKYAIPYYKNSRFAFMSSHALLTFLFGPLGSPQDISEDIFESINDNFYIIEYDVTIWSSGLSSMLCTHFDDEVNNEIEKREITFKEISSWTYKVIYQDDVPKDDIRLTKSKYYTNVKTYFS